MIHQSIDSAPSLKMLVISVTGPDACKFLQGQLTCDVAALHDGQSTLGAYCNIKGKVESLFILHRRGEEYFLNMQQDLIQPTLQELKKYAIFSKVKLDTIERGVARTDEQHEILAKIPAVYKQTIGAFFPHDLNLPALGAVSFTKGCYRGQEIVARMQHRGNLKRSLYIFRTQSSDIEPGAVINTADGLQAGTVVRAYKNDEQTIGLAVLTDTLSDQPLVIAKQSVSVISG